LRFACKHSVYFISVLDVLNSMIMKLLLLMKNNNNREIMKKK